VEPKSEVPPGLGTLLYHPYSYGTPAKELSYPVFSFPLSPAVPPMIPLTGMFPFATSSLPGLSLLPFAYDPSMIGGILCPTLVMEEFCDSGSNEPSPREEIVHISPTEESSFGRAGDGKFPRTSDVIAFDSSWLYPNGSLVHNLTDKFASGVKDKRRYIYRLLVHSYFW
jgi:hypothetical protein